MNSAHLSIQSIGIHSQNPENTCCYSPQNGPLFLSGAPNQGKEQMIQLLTGWSHLPPNLLPLLNDGVLWYSWQNTDCQFMSFHTNTNNRIETLFVQGFDQEQWQKSFMLPFSQWQKALRKQGRKTSKVLSREEYISWIQNRENPLSRSETNIFPSPQLDPVLLHLLATQPEATVPSWEEFWAGLLRNQRDAISECSPLILEYHQQRKHLQREEKLALQLPELKKWQQQAHQLDLERSSLASQYQLIKAQHHKDGRAIRDTLTRLSSEAPKQKQIDSLSNRLGWVEWQIERQGNQPSTSSSAPEIWWQARQLLDTDRQRLQDQLVGLYDHIFSASPRNEEISIIENHLRQMDKDGLRIVAELEGHKQKLEWLRRERDKEENHQKDAHRQELDRLLSQRDALEEEIQRWEQESRRPKNTFRHWLEQHVPDWEKGPGKLLHPAVLNSRGMFPQMERINDLFFGIRVHLEDLPEPNPTDLSHSAPQEQLQAIRQKISDSQIRYLHEQKLLINRFKQKTRLAQKAIQQAEYNLQLCLREKTRISEHAKELRVLHSQQQQQKNISIQYQMSELQEEIQRLSSQISTLDQSWEAWLNEEGKICSLPRLNSMRDSWKKELDHLVRQQQVDSDQRDQQIALLKSKQVEWELIESKLANLKFPDASQDSPSSVRSESVARWLERYQLLQAEEQQLLLDKEEWSQQWPGLEPSSDLIQTLESDSLDTRKSNLASGWFARSSDILKSVTSVKTTLDQLILIHQKWKQQWQNLFEKDMPHIAGLQVTGHPLYKALFALEELMKNHEHAAAGAGLFQVQHPVQTHSKIIDVMDTLYEAWMIWQDESTRHNHHLMNRDTFSSPHHGNTINLSLYISLVTAMEKCLPGPVLLPDSEFVNPNIIRKIPPWSSWICTSTYPLPVSGNHLWIPSGYTNYAGGALPFATE